MLKIILTCAALFIFTNSVFAQSGRVERLRDVSSIYIAEAGQSEKAHALRQEIIKKLNESGRLRVVDAPGEADAVLSLSVRQGSKNVDSPLFFFGDQTPKVGSRVVPADEITFSLNSQSSQTLWAARFDAASFQGHDEKQAARAVGSKLSRELLKAFDKDSKRQR